MKKILVISLLGLIMFPQALFSADFNPNYILSDEEMQNYQSMTRSDIQAFLDEKGGYISNYSSLDWEGEYRKSADIIYRASQESKINPKYILVKLQKEQSLVTSKDPSEKQLDWATGYGVCDSCSMSDPDIQKHKGFGTQVDRSASIMRWYYDNLNNQSWIKRANVTYSIDNTLVTPASNATGFLYSYTPHLHGNENFWNLWQKWFDQIYPDGTLVKAIGQSDVYLIQDGKKRKFENMTSLITRYDPKMIVMVPPTELARYDEGSAISLPNYSIVKTGSKYYLIDYNYKRPFASYDVVKKLGYNPDEIIEVNSSDLDGYVNGLVITTDNNNPLGQIVRVPQSNELFYIQEGTYYPILDEMIAQVNFPHLDIESSEGVDFEKLKTGNAILFKDGVLFGVKGRNKIYVSEKNKKRHIASENVFEGLGYDWKNVVWINQFAGLAHETGSPMSVKPSAYVDDGLIDLSPTPEEIDTPADIPDEEERTIVTDPVGYLIKTSAEELSFVGTQFDTDIQTYLVADYDTGEILAGKNIDFKRPMASLTKVMTGYQLIIDGIALNNATTYNSSLHKATYHMYRIAEGERVKNSDLMYAMLTSSLNTASRMLVNSRGDREDAFIKRMNDQVKAWGLLNTTFTDTSGFDSGNQTTARDYLTIFSKASKNTVIRKYLGATDYEYTELIDVDGKPDHFDSNSNQLVEQSDLPYTILASKTGFLYEAGTCLTMLVERKTDGKEFVIIQMGSPDFGKYTRFHEFKRLADWAVTL